MAGDNSAYAAGEIGTELRGGSADSVRSYAGLIDDKDTLRLLNYYDSILDEPVEESAIGKEILSNVSTETIDNAVKNGAVSQMKAAVGLTGQSEDGRDFYGEVASRLEHEGSIGLVFGAPGSGKTSLTIDAAQVWKARTGGAIIGNTTWDGFDAQFTSDEEMLEEMASRQGPVLAVIDEIAQDLSGFGSGNKAAEQFSNSLLYIRKREKKYGDYAKKGSVLLVAHTRVKTAAALRRVSSFAVEKPKRSAPDRARLLASEGGKDVFNEIGTYQGLTESAANYSEYEPSDFEIVLNDDESSKDDSEESQKRNPEVEKVIRLTQDPDINLTNAEAAKRTQKPGDPDEQYSKGWVDRVVADYNAGRDYQWVNLDIGESTD